MEALDGSVGGSQPAIKPASQRVNTFALCFEFIVKLGGTICVGQPPTWYNPPNPQEGEHRGQNFSGGRRKGEGTAREAWPKGCLEGKGKGQAGWPI